MFQENSLQASVYDYPSYYDVLFSLSWKREYEFLLHAFETYASIPVKRVFEPACGTGRFLWRLAKEGFQVRGLDLNRKSITFCNRRMKRHGLADAAFYGNIAVDLKLNRPIDAAFNLVSSFCHLTSEVQAENHLRLMADVLRPGGVYLLGLHLKPKGVAECESESWSCRRGSLLLSSHLKTIHGNEKERIETIEFRITAQTPNKIVHLLDRFPFRTYTLAQFRKLLRKIGRFEVVQTYNFAFEPCKPNASSEDVIFVLKKSL
ncbi:MAG: methyltransferase domain-containing protein [Planctomycetaceae bacterium]|nr:methyltransferase domain-containing protein [Planctomycetaceae bacterium]